MFQFHSSEPTSWLFGYVDKVHILLKQTSGTTNKVLLLLSTVYRELFVVLHYTATPIGWFWL